VLSHVEVTARVTVTPAAHFVWSNRLAYSHDCFVCLRVGRLVELQHGRPYGICTGNDHPAPIRVSGCDMTEHGSERRMRWRVSFWWAPFSEPGDSEIQGSELPVAPWAQVQYRAGCRVCRDNGVDEWLDVEGTLASGAAPSTTSCLRCGTELLTGSAPEINLVG
jgi:hypothetical protein